MFNRKFLPFLILLLAMFVTSVAMAEGESNGTLYFCLEGSQGSNSLSAILAYASENDLGIGDGCELTTDQKRALDLIYIGVVEDDESALWKVMSEGVPKPAENGNWSYAGVQWANPNSSRIQVVCTQGLGQETLKQLKQDALNGDYQLLESCQEPPSKLHHFSQLGFWDASTDYLWTPFGDGLPVGLGHGDLPYVAWRDPYQIFGPIIASR